VLDITEIHRFLNTPIREGGSMRWNAEGLWRNVRQGLEATGSGRLESIGVDSWGVDYALLDEGGALVENPYHYRDSRTHAATPEVLALVGRERLYAITGVQILPINTLFQLHAACRMTPDSIARARALVTIADFFNYRLTGHLCAEYTIATTTQCLDAASREWSTELLSKVNVPASLFQPVVQPGTLIGPVHIKDSGSHSGTPVVATACHDTASAVASVGRGEGTAFLSSGTWSLLGMELPAPILSNRARDLNFTNEGGVCGTIRFLKNISGLWLLEACRQSWTAAGQEYGYEDLLAAAESAKPFGSLIDPDNESFLNPDRMPACIDRYCARTGQPAPQSPAAYTRTILESLACKYRLVLDSLESVTGIRIDTIRVVGGGAQNRILNQFTADATGRRVIAGPVEATSLGNIAVQMLATGAVGSLAEARAVIERSFPVTCFEPIAHDLWETPFTRFTHYVED